METYATNNLFSSPCVVVRFDPRTLAVAGKHSSFMIPMTNCLAIGFYMLFTASLHRAVTSFSIPRSLLRVHRNLSDKTRMMASSVPTPPSSSPYALSPEMTRQTPKHVVIAGAGVIGTTTAYYLAKEFGIASTIVDPTGRIAPAASGKAGGFLALDWNDYSPIGPLARRSFLLHQTIANDLGPSTIQYRRLTCSAISVGGSKLQERPKGKKLEGIEWAQGTTVMDVRSLGDEETIAQVHPKLFCERLFAKTQELVPETSLARGKVIGAEYDPDNKGRLVGAKLEDGTIVAGDALLYACGPWTANIMTGVKYHSVILPTPTLLSQCVFFSGCGDPEVYVRPDQTAYCTGFPDAPINVQEQPGEEEIRMDAVQKIREAVKKASNLDAEPRTIQSCYLPSTPDGIPLMGPLGNGCFAAAGHSCWGILLGPASGESMAHLIASGNSPHVNLAPFAPSRYGRVLKMVP